MENKIKLFHYKKKYSLVLKQLKSVKYRAFDGANLKAEKPQTKIHNSSSCTLSSEGTCTDASEAASSSNSQQPHHTLITVPTAATSSAHADHALLSIQNSEILPVVL